jgi:hypothetical protein
MKRALLLSCMLSATVIGVEVWIGAGQGAEIETAAASAGSVPTRAGSPDVPGLHVADKGAVDQWVGTILGRPLFAADRRPVPGYATAHAGLPRLAGVIAGPTDAVAIFEAGNGAKPLAVHAGEQVNGWHLTLIDAETVTLQKDGVNTVLRPAFTGEASAPKSAAVEASSSRWVTAASSGILRSRWSNPQLQP